MSMSVDIAECSRVTLAATRACLLPRGPSVRRQDSLPNAGSTRSSSAGDTRAIEYLGDRPINWLFISLLILEPQPDPEPRAVTWQPRPGSRPQ
jgi:hypothetical protein